eukprot:EG_transcript_18687
MIIRYRCWFEVAEVAVAISVNLFDPIVPLPAGMEGGRETRRASTTGQREEAGRAGAKVAGREEVQSPLRWKAAVHYKPTPQGNRGEFWMGIPKEVNQRG